jgi:hypothetical protein
VKEPKMEKGIKETDRLSGLLEDPGLYPGFGMVPKRVIHEPDYGKKELDWKPVNWVWQSKIRG